MRRKVSLQEGNRASPQAMTPPPTARGGSMCVTLNLPDGEYVTVIAELDAALGWPAPINDGYEDLGDRKCCLCPVDMDELARLTGWTIEPDDFDSMEKVATLPRSKGR